MKEPPVIEVRNLVKEYRLGALEGVKTLAKRLMGRPVPPRQRFRALDNVSFSIRRGEVVGIIGHNGAGKSTLLKMLCNITTPTSGSVTVRGRVAPLIEVGAGLVGDMTGRENIYLNASILGLTRTHIDELVDDIIDFAELREFIDTPLKRYSSGMQVRLGYAIATAIESDVLIVDEVLAVGDLQFQRKSIERIQRLIRDKGRTVLIVGHNIRQLERICTRIIALQRGTLVDDGLPAPVVSRFFQRVQDTEIARLAHATNPTSGWTIEHSAEINVSDVTLSNSAGHPAYEISTGTTAEVKVTIDSPRDYDRIDIGVAFQTLEHLPVAISPLTSSLPVPLSLRPGRNQFVCHIPNVFLLPGNYCLRVAIKDAWGQMLWGADNISPFKVVAPEGVNRARYSDYAFVQFPGSWNVVPVTEATRALRN